MTVVLMIAEKPSLAQSLATILSNGRQKSRKAVNNACSVHEYRSSFRGHKEVLFKFTSVCGHVFSTNFVSKYNNWDTTDPQDLFDCATIKEEANPKLNLIKFLQKETVFRAKFSAITDKDIKSAMNSLILPNELESLSVDARQELDLRIGCAFTRFQTRFFHGKYGDLDSSLISFGPCQTPTLGFCVDRHDKIQTFKPEPYWVLSVSVRSATNECSPTMTLEWDRGREFNQNTAKSYLNSVKSQKRAKIVSISTKEKTKPRPNALNTVELLKICSSGLGIGPHTTMQIAERLYTQGYISYPRTETNQYPNNFDLVSTLRTMALSNDWGQEVKQLLEKGITKPKSGHDAGDHPPITPMKIAQQHELGDRDSYRIYEYICRHFIASISADMRYDQTTLSFVIGSENFSKQASIVTDPGFTRFMSWHAIPNEQKLSSNLKVGDEFLITDAKLLERMTTAPDYLTESELISLMEKHGIGTDASIPTHINNICLRNYVKIGTGRRLIPTQLGIVLVHGYQKIDSDLVLPTRRAALEIQLNEIAAGRVDFETVLNKTIKEFRNKFLYFMEHIPAMDELFEVCFSSLADSGKPISRCGKCRRYLKLIVAKPQRVYCATCNETYSIPQNGNIKTYRELRCPIDDFELLYFYRTGASDKSFVLCVHCFNNPPFESMPKSSGCNQCPNEECKHSMISNTLTECQNCKFGGQLVLDPGSGPPTWRVGCNKCTFSMSAFKDAQRVTVENQRCDQCSRRLCSIEYKSDKSRLKDGSLQFHGCVWCSDEYSSLVQAMSRLQTNFATSSRANGSDHRPSYQLDGGSNSSRGGRGGGRGGRGRGRGRGRGGGRGGRGRGRDRDRDMDDDYSHSAPKGAMTLSDFM
ncbi:unnamed protein product [Oppiella nova]|uniref:DNA topoisomerase n=1 Tax=Oppiella nova TaxID=334625 RepID=A0A7R9LJE9_9ACAR|nr:unnamed protein product [Oppiella nova]CAG2163578.1 unnamed protein product [Oppiella nova]